MKNKLTRMPGRVTIKDIARKLNLSGATVSRALNNSSRISEGTKKAVLFTAGNLGYRRNTLASSLRSGKSFTIAIIVPSSYQGVTVPLIKQLVQLAAVRDYNLLIAQCDEDPQKHKKMMDKIICASVDGVLLVAVNPKVEEDCAELKKRNIPFIFLDSAAGKLGAPAVLSDEVAAGFLATEHLIQAGYKRIAFIGKPVPLSRVDFFWGYRQALSSYNFMYDKTLVYSATDSIAVGAAASKYFFNLDLQPDAILVPGVGTACGIIAIAKKAERDIPNQLGLVCYSDEPFCEYTTPGLTSVDKLPEEIANHALSWLIDLINNRKKKEKIKQQWLIQPVLRVRGSSSKRDGQ